MYFKYDNYVDQYCQALLASDALDILLHQYVDML